MAQLNLSGLGVAMVTPFNRDGSIDFDALDSLVEQQIAAGTDFLVVLGTTAETPTLSDPERHAVMRRVKEKADGRIPLVVGYGGNNTALLVKQIKEEDLSGYCAILSVVPFYNKPTQEGLFQHFKAVAEASPVPVILYNVPGRTGDNMLPATTLRLAREIPNAAAVKEASGNIAQITEIIQEAPEGFKVFSGDDGLTFDVVKNGGHGVISVLGNAYPAEFGEMVHACMSQDWEKASRLNERFHEITRLLFADGNPGGIKALLSCQNKIKNVLRLPLVSVRKEVYDDIQKEAERL